MQANLSLTSGYRMKISRAARVSELVDRAINGLAALGGSVAFLEVLRRWLQRRQEKRQEPLQLDIHILEEGHALREEGLPGRARGPAGPRRGARAPPQGGDSRPGKPRYRLSWRPSHGQTRGPHPALGGRHCFSLRRKDRGTMICPTLESAIRQAAGLRFTVHSYISVASRPGSRQIPSLRVLWRAGSCDREPSSASSSSSLCHEYDLHELQPFRRGVARATDASPQTSGHAGADMVGAGWLGVAV
jgi:hypothetical protein